MASRPSLGAGALVAAGVFAALVVATVAPTVPYVILDRAYGQAPLDYLPLILGAQLTRDLAGFAILALWIGVWVTFILPLRDRHGAWTVVARSLLGLVTGAVLAAVLGYLLSGEVQSSPYTPLGTAREAAKGILSGIARLFFDGLFLVPLAGLLLWGGLRGSRLPDAP